jgi:hypothetical protein
MRLKILHRLFFLGVSTLSLVFFSCSIIEPRKIISLKEAEGIVLTQILENNIEGKVVYELQTKMKSGTTVKNGIITNGNEYTVEKDCWFFFIDDAPGAKWAHPCRYVFVYCSDGEYKVVDEEWPPDNFDDLVSVEF